MGERNGRNGARAPKMGERALALLLLILASSSALPFHPTTTDSVPPSPSPQVSLISCAVSSDGDQGKQGMQCLREHIAAMNAATVPPFFIVAAVASSGVVVPPPPMLGNASSWVTFSDAASTSLGQMRLGFVLSSGRALQARHGPLLNAIEVDLFASDAQLPGVLGAYFISEGRVLLSLEAGKEVPEGTAALIASHLSPLLDMKATLGGAAAQWDSALAGAEPNALGPFAAREGPGVGKMPWKCFACVVSMATLMPLLVNTALQAETLLVCKL
ncbi:hypothetical protein T484DRAFT_1898995 [Baffinella frigidus]|nr:hypothetical protein T484DRAFT_1898995 [Cryptophyta sp. CCMP2293]